MEKDQTTKVSIDLYPEDIQRNHKKVIGLTRCKWNMLDPKPMGLALFGNDKWIMIEFEGKKYITDRSILKGIL